MSTVGVIGLGKVGLPYALTLAAAGHDVHVWDSNAEVRDAITRGDTSYLVEPGVHDAFIDFGDQLTVHSPADIRQHVNVVFVVVPTPSFADGKFDSSYVQQVIQALGKTVGRPITIALVSTVSPGTCRTTLLPMTTRYKMSLVYVPAMIALGSVMDNLRTPDLQLIGGDDEQAMALVSATLPSTTVWTPYFSMSFESAEIAKLASNVYTTMKISFANLLGRMCTTIPHANVDDVTEALGYNRVIGHKTLTAGAGYGGPCYPRDAHAFAAAGGSFGNVVHAMNEEHLHWITSFAIAQGETFPKTFTVFGRAYSDNTTLRIESFGDRLALLLGAKGLIETPAAEADVVIIAMPMRGASLRTAFKKNAIVIDMWRSHPYLASEDVNYVPFGVSGERKTDGAGTGK